MRGRTILILILVVSLGAAIEAFVWSGGFSTASTASTPEPEILVAAAQLPVGTLIRPEDVEWRRWKGDAPPPPHAIEHSATATATDDGLGEVTGAVLRRALDRGDPIIADAIAKPGDRGFLAAVLEPGMRALSVPVNAMSGTTGLIYPGDRVDVILTQTFKETEVSAGRRSAGETVAQNLRVLAIDQRMQTARTDPTLDKSGARTVTLEASPHQSEQIAVATELGKLSLTLRSLLGGNGDAQSPAGADTPSEQGPVWAEDVSSALRATLQRNPVEQRGALLILRGGRTDPTSKPN
jgi:pilus assembly protein CpaB